MKLLLTSAGIMNKSIHNALVDMPGKPIAESKENTMAAAEKWAAGMQGPACAIDDQIAIQVIGGAVEVVSEGYWKLFSP